jgi:hypothetical protein
MRLVHEPPDELASSEVTARTLRPHIVRFALFFIIEFLLFAFWVVATLLSLSSRVTDVFTGQTSDGGSGGLSTLVGVLFLLVGVVWFVSLFIPVREPIAEYGVLLEGRASAAERAYQWISQTIHARRTPFRIGDASVGGRGLLTLRSDAERAAVIVTTYGSDLYLGWTMWRQRSTASVIIHLFRDILDIMRGGTYASDVRLATTRAFRELVHSVTREGAQTAISSSDK